MLEESATAESYFVHFCTSDTSNHIPNFNYWIQPKTEREKSLKILLFCEVQKTPIPLKGLQNNLKEKEKGNICILHSIGLIKNLITDIIKGFVAPFYPGQFIDPAGFKLWLALLSPGDVFRFSHTAQRTQDNSKFWVIKKKKKIPPVFDYLSAKKLISEDNSISCI